MPPATPRGDGERRRRLRTKLRHPPASLVRVRYVDPAELTHGRLPELSHPIDLQENR